MSAINMEQFYFIPAIISDMAALTFCHFIYLAFYKPEKFLELNYRYQAPSSFEQPSLLRRLPFYVHWALVFLGCFLVFFFAAEHLLSWIPHWWVAQDEDGETTWVSTSLAVITALYGGIAFLGGLDNVASRLAAYQELRGNRAD